MLLTPNLLLIFVIVLTISASLGSFFKVIVDRYGTQESLIFKSSHCPSCKTKLYWWHNIPIISFLILRGKCFFCKTKIDIYCFYSELVTAIIALLLLTSSLIKNEGFLEIAGTLTFAMVLILLSMLDIKHKIVPHTITYLAIIFILIFQIIGRNIPITTVFANLGIAFLFMDFLYILSTLIKKFELETSLISIPLFIWSIIYLVNQKIYFIFIAILFYLLVLRLKISNNTPLIFWLVLFLLVPFQCYKLALINYNLTNLILYFCGIGIIYFVCEIFYYFIILFFVTKGTSLHDKTTNQSITIGGGDITVFVLISVFLGYKLAFLTLFAASLLALISHFTMRKQDLKQISFVPFLAMASFIIIITINGY